MDDLIARLLAALKPFAEFPAARDDRLPADLPMTQGSPLAARQITVADFRRARAAYRSAVAKEGEET